MEFEDYNAFVNDRLGKLNEMYEQGQHLVANSMGENYYISYLIETEHLMQKHERDENLRIVRNKYGLHGAKKNLGGFPVVIYVY